MGNPSLIGSHLKTSGDWLWLDVVRIIWAELIRVLNFRRFVELVKVYSVWGGLRLEIERPTFLI